MKGRLAECYICQKTTKQTYRGEKKFRSFIWDWYQCDLCGANFLENGIERVKESR